MPSKEQKAAQWAQIEESVKRGLIELDAGLLEGLLTETEVDCLRGTSRQGGTSKGGIDDF